MRWHTHRCAAERGGFDAEIVGCELLLVEGLVEKN
jgi:hypothetical protein